MGSNRLQEKSEHLDFSRLTIVLILPFELATTRKAGTEGEFHTPVFLQMHGDNMI